MRVVAGTERRKRAASGPADQKQPGACTQYRFLTPALAVLALAAASCAGSQVRSRTQATAGLIATARDHGAMRCAPVELAMAESHNDFAEHALDEGDYHDARREAEIAETNAQLAIEKSPAPKCTEAGPPIATGPGDADGDGVPDNVDQCPRIPEDRDGWQDDDGCPDPDNDGDGITDQLDRCPNEPEDRDGWQDDDGCPDPDNDGDGIVDQLDQCPDEPEDKDGWQDADGCPDPDNDKDGILDVTDKCPDEAGVPPDGCPRKYKLVVVTPTKIELKQTVFFATNRAAIRPVSFALLGDVARAMNDSAAIKVEIQGHTDSQGAEAFNLALSQKRAEAVRTYLIKQGIASNRMVAQGYGESVPIADNRTAAGRAQNRRVEFVITAR